MGRGVAGGPATLIPREADCAGAIAQSTSAMDEAERSLCRVGAGAFKGGDDESRVGAERRRYLRFPHARTHEKFGTYVGHILLIVRFSTCKTL